MDTQLTGKTALVTGASSGIGRACAKALALEGVQVTVVARRGELLEALAAEIEAARLMIYRAASLMDEGEQCALEAAMGKRFATDMAMRVTTEAVQILGGYGYMKSYPVEMYMRFAKISQIFEGTNQVQRIVIARELTKTKGAKRPDLY